MKWYSIKLRFNFQKFTSYLSLPFRESSMTWSLGNLKGKILSRFYPKTKKKHFSTFAYKLRHNRIIKNVYTTFFRIRKTFVERESFLIWEGKKYGASKDEVLSFITFDDIFSVRSRTCLSFTTPFHSSALNWFKHFNMRQF